ncbi:MAG TPA: acyl-CoA dehydrogenase family protein, partial [Actinomycetota bacterium]|nr:acyl-CoA dehydrogenase family protein [Actinomycetota bacterium]
MNFDLDQDERALQAAIRDLCKGVFPMETVRSLESSGGVSAETWRALEDAGVFSLRLPESEGGAGLGMTAGVIVFEQLGRALVPGPLVGTHLARTLGISGSKVTFAYRDDLLISYLDRSDAVAVIDAEGVSVISQNGIAGVPVAQPLDPLTPVSRVSSFPGGERL